MFNCIFKVINFAAENNLLILRCVPFLSLVRPIILRVTNGLVDCLDKIMNNIAFHNCTAVFIRAYYFPLQIKSSILQILLMLTVTKS